MGKRKEELKVKRSTKGTTEIYRFVFEPSGWALFVLDDTTGLFSIESDWGGYSYCWPAPGRGRETLKEFIATAGCDYMATKFSYGKERSFRETFDGDAVKKDIKRDIIEARRDQRIDTYRARELWDDLEYWDTDSEHDFYCNMPHEVSLFYNGDTSELARYRPSATYDFLVDTLLPFFQGILKAELEQAVKVTAIGR